MVAGEDLREVCCPAIRLLLVGFQTVRPLLMRFHLLHATHSAPAQTIRISISTSEMPLGFRFCCWTRRFAFRFSSIFYRCTSRTTNRLGSQILSRLSQRLQAAQ